MTDPIPMPNFGDGTGSFRAWLEHPNGYRAGHCFKLKASPPREDWPVDLGEIIDRKRELASLNIQAAARLMREAEDLAVLAAARLET